MSAHYDEFGDLVKITCNGCGAIVGEEVMIKKGNKKAWSFKRKENYMEAKIGIKIGNRHGFHIINGCRKCLESELDLAVLTDWVKKDRSELVALAEKDLEAIGVVQVGVGIP